MALSIGLSVSVAALNAIGRPGVGVAAAASGTLFSPYVDATEWPTFAFDDVTSSPATNVTLGFIVASRGAPCTPSWGTYYSLDTVAAIDMAGRIERLRRRGGNVTVSFGGAANAELAGVCTSAALLTGAYRAVVERYDLDGVDFDIEGAALADRYGTANSVDRRAQAAKALQDQRRSVGRPLAVWLTLPVLTSGLTADGVATVDAFLRSGVDLAGVNVMTMDYGNVPAGGTDMGAYAIEALRSTASQVASSYRSVGVQLSGSGLWAKLGATPMIGQNDITSERFLMDDAIELQTFARANGLGRISLWSANRDRPCPSGAVGFVAGNCSGIAQAPNAFSAVFGGAGGTPATTTIPPPTTTSQPAPPTVVPATTIATVPTTTPAGVTAWSPSTPYPGGSQVSRNGAIYRAKWWNIGFAPDTPVAQTWDTPWARTVSVPATTLAPPTTVPPTAVPATTLAPPTTLPATTLVPPTTLPATTLAPPTTLPPTTTTTSPGGSAPWRPEVAYWAGTRVLQSGGVYEAKWWSQGFAPDTPVAFPWDSPWKRVA